jgi:hypothetical protein
MLATHYPKPARKMNYIDILIPLAIGLIFVFNNDVMVKANDPAYEKKTSTIKKVGYAILVIAVLYGIGKIAS